MHPHFAAALNLHDLTRENGLITTFKFCSIFSSENVDLVGRRERFMQSTFDSLSTAELDANTHIHNSISNQYREGSAVQRNAVTIARAQSLRDNAQNRRREELQKRIEETRKKLQTVTLRLGVDFSYKIFTNSPCRPTFSPEFAAQKLGEF